MENPNIQGMYKKLLDYTNPPGTYKTNYKYSTKFYPTDDAAVVERHIDN